MNSEDIINLLDRRIDTVEFDSDIGFELYIKLIIETFGDNQEEILDFMENADKKYTSYFNEFYEEMVEKFQTDEMEAMFVRFN